MHLRQIIFPSCTGWPENPFTPAKFIAPPSVPLRPPTPLFAATLTQENDGGHTDAMTD